MTGLNPLKLARLEAGKSQWDVAKETSIPQTTVSLYERGYLEPKQDHKEALAKAYSKKVEELWSSH